LDAYSEEYVVLEVYNEVLTSIVSCAIVVVNEVSYEVSEANVVMAEFKLLFEVEAEIDVDVEVL
jgi:hypothetical protein